MENFCAVPAEIMNRKRRHRRKIALVIFTWVIYEIPLFNLFLTGMNTSFFEILPYNNHSISMLL